MEPVLSLRPLNLGYSGARTENILWNIKNGELDGQSPKVITLMIGTNNADADAKHFPTHHNGVQIAGGIKAIIAAPGAKCPNSKILLLRRFPAHTGARGRLPTAAPGSCFRAGHEGCRQQARLLLRREPRLPESRRLDQSGVDARLASSESRGGQALGAGHGADALQIDGRQIARRRDPRQYAVVPVPKLENDCYDWHARHAAVLCVKDRIKPQIVLIGDSITHFWGGEPKDRPANGPQAFAAVFAPYRVLNLGFGWDRTQNVLWRLDRGEIDGLHPRVVVIHIGSNNTSQTGKPAKTLRPRSSRGSKRFAAVCVPRCPVCGSSSCRSCRARRSPGQSPPHTDRPDQSPARGICPREPFGTARSGPQVPQPGRHAAQVVDAGFLSSQRKRLHDLGRRPEAAFGAGALKRSLSRAGVQHRKTVAVAEGVERSRQGKSQLKRTVMED